MGIDDSIDNADATGGVANATNPVIEAVKPDTEPAPAPATVEEATTTGGYNTTTEATSSYSSSGSPARNMTLAQLAPGQPVVYNSTLYTMVSYDETEAEIRLQGAADNTIVTVPIDQLSSVDALSADDSMMSYLFLAAIAIFVYNES